MVGYNLPRLLPKMKLLKFCFEKTNWCCFLVSDPSFCNYCTFNLWNEQLSVGLLLNTCLAIRPRHYYQSCIIFNCAFLLIRAVKSGLTICINTFKSRSCFYFLNIIWYIIPTELPFYTIWMNSHPLLHVPQVCSCFLFCRVLFLNY